MVATTILFDVVFAIRSRALLGTLRNESLACCLLFADLALVLFFLQSLIVLLASFILMPCYLVNCTQFVATSSASEDIAVLAAGMFLTVVARSAPSKVTCYCQL